VRAASEIVPVTPAVRHHRRRTGRRAAGGPRAGLRDARRCLEEALGAQAGLERVPPVAELSSTTAIKAAVAAGIGPAVLSSLAVTQEPAAGTLRAVPVTGLELTRRLLAVWPDGRQLTGAAAGLRAIASRPG
jgi:DNA-binding transcriptional LysR family regulator